MKRRRILMVSGNAPAGPRRGRRLHRPAPRRAGPPAPRLALVLALPPPALVPFAGRPPRRADAAPAEPYVVAPGRSAWSRRRAGLAPRPGPRPGADPLVLRDRRRLPGRRRGDLGRSAARDDPARVPHRVAERPVHVASWSGRSTVVIANDPRNAERCLAETGRDARSPLVERRHGLAPRPRFAPGDRPRPAHHLRVHQRPEVARGRRRGAATAPARVAGGPLEGHRPVPPRVGPRHAALARTRRPDGVEFTGGFSVDGPRLKRLLAESEIMLLPYADGASERRTTLHVAWAFGLPVITTPPPTANDAVVDGENCLLVREPTAAPGPPRSAASAPTAASPTASAPAASPPPTGSPGGAWRRCTSGCTTGSSNRRGRRGSRSDPDAGHQ